MGGQSNAIGQVAGGPAIGLIGTVVSLRAAMVAAGLALAPALLLYGRALRQDRSTMTVPAEAKPSPSEP
jgi:hypothetical protein